MFDCPCSQFLQRCMLCYFSENVIPMVTFFDAFFISKNKNIFAADISELEATDLDSFEISSVDHPPVSQSSYWVFLEKTNTLKFST